MARILKFRAWEYRNTDLLTGKNNPVMRHWNYFMSHTDWLRGLFAGNNHNSSKQYYPYIAMQFIGLKDRNGIEIYESDIVKLHNVWQDLESPYDTFIVRLSQISNLYFEVLKQTDDSKKTSAYRKGDNAQLGDWVYQYLQVIGNIYENKDLLIV